MRRVGLVVIAANNKVRLPRRCPVDRACCHLNEGLSRPPHGFGGRENVLDEGVRYLDEWPSYHLPSLLVQ